jgi:hypothetical protein
MARLDHHAPDGNGAEIAPQLAEGTSFRRDTALNGSAAAAAAALAEAEAAAVELWPLSGTPTEAWEGWASNAAGQLATNSATAAASRRRARRAAAAPTGSAGPPSAFAAALFGCRSPVTSDGTVAVAYLLLTGTGTGIISMLLSQSLIRF